MNRWLLFLLIISLFSCKEEVPPPPSEAEIALGDYFEKLSSEGKFSGSVLVGSSNKVVFKKSYGMADVDFGLKNIDTTRYLAGSINKTVTAAAVLILEERGLLKVDDNIGKYISEFPNGDLIKIKHLLSHTSGLGREAYYDYIYQKIDEKSFEYGILEKINNEDLRRFFKNSYIHKKDGYYYVKELPEYERYIIMYYLFATYFYRDVKEINLNDAAIKMIKNQSDKIYLYTPGYTFNYSNYGYILLGLLIERVSGQRYEDFVKDNIFTPAGMVNSGFGYSHVTTPNMGQAYIDYLGNQEYLPMEVDMKSWPGAAGMLYTTTEDLYRFVYYLLSGRLMESGEVVKMLTPVIRSNFKGSDYGYGVYIKQDEINGLSGDVIWHDGWIYNFRGLFYVFDYNVYVVILSNVPDEVNINRMAKNCIEIYRKSSVKM